MPVHNADIAAVFGEIADLLEIEQANPFRIRGLPGLGEKTEANILQAVEAHLFRARRIKLVGAVHSRFELPRAKQTERILRAMDNRYFTLLAHPTGRVIESRAPYDVDMLRILRHARQRGCHLELNAHPERLDLQDSHCLMAREEGVLVAVNSDAHSTDDFANLGFGVGQARRGWLEPGDVLNTRPLPELRQLLAQARI